LAPTSSITTSFTTTGTSRIASATSTTLPATGTSTDAISTSTPGAVLSAGAIAGISIGAFLIALIICLLTWIVWRQRRLLRERSGPSAAPDSLPEVAELASHSRKWRWFRAAELSGSNFWPSRAKAPAELDAEPRSQGREVVPDAEPRVEISEVEG